MSFPDARLVPLASGIELSVHEAGRGPVVVLCHGFPDLAFGWRHQVEPLVDAGFRVVVPDGRGYGASSAPAGVADYGMAQLTGDLVELLDVLGVDRAVVVGHDWGGWVVWGASVLHPARVAGVVGVCTPYLPFPSVAVHLDAVGGDPERQYVAWFQEPGVAEREMDADVDRLIRTVFRTGASSDEVIAAALADGSVNMNPFLYPDAFGELGEPLLTTDELDRYVSTFARTGFRGGINWYRNIDQNAAAHPDVGTATLELPALMITADRDPALTPAMAEGMRARCTDLEYANIDGAGHWVHQEHPDRFNAVVVDWLRRRFLD